MKVLITGICGQDGSYLAKHLLDKGYEVHGIARLNTDDWRHKKLGIKPVIHRTDVTEYQHIQDIIAEHRYDQIYNLAAQSHVGHSFKTPNMTSHINYNGLINVIEGVKRCGLRKTRIYQASTSELYGYNNGEVLTENSPFSPKSPYAVSKLASYWACVNARKEGIFAVNGILFNHESPLRGKDFVTRKITSGIARSIKEDDFVLELGNMEAKRDWGFAGDFVKGMNMIVEAEEPADYILATREAHSVEQFLMHAILEAYDDPEVEIKGKGIDAKWYVNERLVVKINPEYYRPNDVHCLIGDYSKVKYKLGWQPETSFEQLVKMMIREDMKDG